MNLTIEQFQKIIRGDVTLTSAADQVPQSNVDMKLIDDWIKTKEEQKTILVSEDKKIEEIRNIFGGDSKEILSHATKAYDNIKLIDFKFEMGRTPIPKNDTNLNLLIKHIEHFFRFAHLYIIFNYDKTCPFYDFPIDIVELENMRDYFSGKFPEDVFEVYKKILESENYRNICGVTPNYVLNSCGIIDTYAAIDKLRPEIDIFYGMMNKISSVE